MRMVLKLKLILLLCALSSNIMFSQNRFNPNFKYKIKGEKSEYNAKDFWLDSKKISIDISNIKNTFGTDRYPEYVEDHGGGLYSKDEYIQIFEIFKNSLDHNDYKKLTSTNDYIGIFIVYYPGGKPFEVWFTLGGRMIEKIPMDCFNKIEEEIKRGHTVQKLKNINDRYMQLKYEFRFNDLDSRQFDGEKVQLSNLALPEFDANC